MKQNYIDVSILKKKIIEEFSYFIIIFRLTYNPIVIFQVKYYKFWGANGASCHLKLVQCADINNPKSTKMVNLNTYV